MANKKISELPASTPQLADELPAARAGDNVKLTVSGLVDLSQVYTNPDYPAIGTVIDALNQLLYTALTVTSFTSDVGTVEIGTVVNAVNLAWAYNKPVVVSQTLTPGPGVLPAADRAAALVGLGLTADTTFTITGNDGVQGASKTAQVLFRHKRFWGVSATETPLDGSFIDSLAGSEFSTSRNQTQTLNGGGQYLYFAWPSAWSGSPSFTVNGFPVTGWVKTTVTYVNSAGYASSFDVYRSQYPQFGTGIQVQVS